MDYQRIIDKIAAELNGLEDHGKVATYIPELGSVNSYKFVVQLTTVKYKNYFFGNSKEKSSIQSIAKVL